MRNIETLAAALVLSTAAAPAFAGQGWNGQGWNGQGWNGQGWNGQGWNGQSWNGQGWNGQAWNGQLAQGLSPNVQGDNGNRPVSATVLAVTLPDEAQTGAK